MESQTISDQRDPLEEVVGDIERLLAKSPIDADIVFDRILVGTQELIAAKRGQILTVEPSYLRVRATTGKELRGTVVPLETSFCGKFVVLTGKSHNASDLRDPKYKDAYINLLGENGLPMLSEMAVPVLGGDKVIAVINVESPETNAFDTSHGVILERLASATAVALRLMVREELIAREESIQHTRHRIDTTLAIEPLDANSVFDQILQEAQGLIKSEKGQLLIVHPDFLSIHATTGKEARGTVVPLKSSFCGKFVVLTGKAHIAQDLREPRYKGAYVDFLGEEGMPMLSELAVPVFSGETMIGILNFESPLLSAFNLDHQQIIEQFADATAVALRIAAEATERKNLIRLQAAEKRIKDTVAAEPFDPDMVFNCILSEAMALIGAERGQVLLVHPDCLTIRTTTGREAQGTIVPLETSFCGKFVVPTGDPHYASDLRESKYEDAYINYLGEDGTPMLSELAVPVSSGEEMIGIINLESPDVAAFDENDLAILCALANDAAIALRRAADRQLEDEIKEIVREIAEANVPLDDWLNRVLDRALQLLRASNGQYLEIEGDRLSIKAWAGESPPMNLNLRLDNCITGHVAVTKTEVCIPDVDKPPWTELYKGFSGQTKSEVAVPLLYAGHVVGVLNIESSRANAFTDRHAQILSLFAQPVALALHLLKVEENQEQVLHNLRGRLILIKNNTQKAIRNIKAGKIPSIKSINNAHKATEVLLDVVSKATAQTNLLPIKLEAIVNKLLGQIPSNGVQIEASFDQTSNTIPLVLADPDRLLEILNLLVDNAIDALKEVRQDDPRLIFAIDPAPSTDHVRLLITDNGRGMPEHIRRDLFKGITTKNALRGSGIGLPYCRHMMHKMLGEIRVKWTQEYPNPDHGTCMDLGFRKVAGVILRTSSLAILTPEEKPLIQLFSDNLRFIELASQYLEQSTYKISTSKSYQLSDIDIQAIDHQATLLIIDLISQPDLGLRLLELMAHYKTNKNRDVSDETRKEYYGIYPLWELPKTKTGLFGLIKDVYEDVPKGKLV